MRSLPIITSLKLASGQCCLIETRLLQTLIIMAPNSQFTPPRKKIKILWWLGGVFVLLVLLFVLQLFGPNPPIVVSPQTTYITEPLGLDGLPDYEQYFLNVSR